MARVEPVVEPVLVAGAGAVGSVIGGLLAARGWPVTLVGRPDHLDAIRRDGLRVEGLFGEHHVRGRVRHQRAGVARHVPHRPSDRQGVGHRGHGVRRREAVGAGRTSAVAPERARQPRATAAIVGDRRVLGGRVIFGAEIVEPGRVLVTVEAAPVLIGSPDPDDATRVAAAGRWAGRWPTPACRRAARQRSLPSCGRRRCTTPPSTPWGRSSACPYGRLPTTATPAPSWTTSWRRPSPSPVPRASVCPGPTPKAIGGCSMASSCRRRQATFVDVAGLERGRPTEIDAINGHLARRAAGAGLRRRCTPRSQGDPRPRAPRARSRPSPLALTRSTLEDMLAHARETGAEECCGACRRRARRRARDPLRQRPNLLHAREPDT